MAIITDPPLKQSYKDTTTHLTETVSRTPGQPPAHLDRVFYLIRHPDKEALI